MMENAEHKYMRRLSHLRESQPISEPVGGGEPAGVLPVAGYSPDPVAGPRPALVVAGPGGVPVAVGPAVAVGMYWIFILNPFCENNTPKEYGSVSPLQGYWVFPLLSIVYLHHKFHKTT